MLKSCSKLDFDRPSKSRNYEMDRAVSLTRPDATIHRNGREKHRFEQDKRLILFNNGGQHNSTTCNILHLAESDTLAAKLFDDRLSCFCRSPAWLKSSLSECSHDRLIRFIERQTILFQQLDVLLVVGAFA